MAETARKALFYPRSYTCLFCGTRFEAYRLYPTARDANERWHEYFDYPYYNRTDSAGRFADFLAIEVRVCPECAFASNDDTQFTTERAAQEAWEPEPEEKEAIDAEAPERLAIAAGAIDLKAFPRELTDALIAYTLAIRSSTALLNANRRNSIEAARLGNYALKSAHLCEALGQNEQVVSWRRSAMEYFQKAYELDLKGLTLYRTLYQLGALAIYFGDDRTASRTYEFLKNLLVREPVRDCSRYLQRLKRLWEDRDMHRLKP